MRLAPHASPRAGKDSELLTSPSNSQFSVFTLHPGFGSPVHASTTKLYLWPVEFCFPLCDATKGDSSNDDGKQNSSKPPWKGRDSSPPKTNAPGSFYDLRRSTRAIPALRCWLSCWAYAFSCRGSLHF